MNLAIKGRVRALSRGRRAQEIDRAWTAWHIYALPLQDKKKRQVTLADLIGSEPSPTVQRQTPAEISAVMTRWRVAKAWQAAERQSPRQPGE